MLIAGGGIGGLATALGLAQKGFRVIVLERAPVLGEIGAGIQLGPNAFHAFDYLGVGDAARAMVASATFGRRQTRRAGGPVRFAKLLGTGGTGFTTRSADLTRWVTLTVWDSPVTTTPAPPPWARHALDHWGARLAPLTSRGRWSGEAPFAAPGRSVAATWDGEVLALTRARLTTRRVAAFWRAVPAVAASMPG